MLIDVHAHFYHDRTPRADWQERNASRLRAGAAVGITTHIASILGSWGRTSPTYFPSRVDLDYANDWMLRLQEEHGALVHGYAAVNPNYQAHALAAIDRMLERGMIGIKLAASRRANDPLLDPIAGAAARHGVPILQHVWQARGRDWPGQEASDATELAELAGRHPSAAFILAHIGGGGDWRPSLHVVRTVPNVFVDLSGSGVDGGMLEACLEFVGVSRLLWGCDITIDTGLAKLRYLGHVLSDDDLEAVRWRNAAGLFHLATPAAT